MLRFIVICFFSCFYNMYCQNHTIDSSYTVLKEYQKQLKSYSFIKAVKAKQYKELIQYTKEYKQINTRHLNVTIIHRQKKSRQSRAIILIHGGGWKSGSPSHLIPMAEELALKGYVCFVVEYRLSGEAIYPAGVEDVISCIDYIKDNSKHYQIDANQLILLGCSSGGQMASLVGVKHPNIKAIVNLDGVLAFHHPKSKEGKAAAQWLGGTYAQVPDIWEDASALTHLTKDSPPMLFINSDFERFHAGRDDVVSLMKNYGTYYEIHQIHNAPHTFWLFEPWFKKIPYKIVKFLDKITAK